MFKNLICPVSNEKIDSYVSQLTSFMNFTLVLVSIITHKPLFLYMAAFDCCIRAFSSGRFSPLRLIAIQLTKIFRWEPKMIDKASKVFASSLGFLCLLVSSILINIDLSVASNVIAGMATSLFLLDAFGIICVGCLIYHTVVFPFYQN